MEEQVIEKKNKAVQKSATHCLIRVKKETRKRVLQDLARANKKEIGKKVRTDVYFALAVSKVTAEDLEKLQNESLTHSDRLELDYRDYVSQNGHISKDEYLGKRLNGEISNSTVISTETK